MFLIQDITDHVPVAELANVTAQPHYCCYAAPSQVAHPLHYFLLPYKAVRLISCTVFLHIQV